jgi:hypothetical protein
VFPLDEAPVQLRHAFGELVGRARRPGVAAVREAFQGVVGVDQFVVGYRVEGAGRSLAEVLAQPDPFARLDAMLQVLRAVPGWWEAVGPPLLPMPAEVVLTAAGPCLLPVAGRRLPRASAALRVPVRASFLAPEFARMRCDLPWDDATWRKVDAFALGAALLRCFHDLPDPPDGAAALRLAAVGLLAEVEEDRCILPFWLRRVEAARYAVRLIRDLVAPEAERRALAPEHLADLLDQCRRGMEPLAAIRHAIAFDTPLAAMQLLQDILFSQESYELLILGGQLANRLDWPMAAVDFYERAIAREPNRRDAYEAQFVLLASARDRPGLLQDHYRADGATAAELETRLWRDFGALPPDSQREHEVALARHLLWCGLEFHPSDLVRAVRFIRPRLSDPATGYRWDAYELNLAYAEALAFQAVSGDPDATGGLPVETVREAARAQLSCMRQWLDWAKARDLATPDDYDHYMDQVRFFEMVLSRLN